ncbi:FAD/NAD(P)-binding protein [Streptomyces iconiensis]|uniref:FAD/NAD(P)-binding protein n=1 Tax=Streptomyces iconiensis TaxID=1384038 RepID=A0ABT6ZNB9_9ACTN|nr:FAD/NAD(P)-binding protein [Streptomyces iconiensis]MDJ1130544.1 FAD/NAD(P)-binding protein [Streptomyces iconiensis]
MPDRFPARGREETDGATGEGRPFEVGVVGAGPRGLSVLERLCANERAAPSHHEMVVHLVDPFLAGAGRVWRTDQSRLLLMNTVASQITVFTDASVEIAGPIEPGPSLYEWARTVALLGEFDGYDEEDLAEARGLGPDAYPTRVLYGHYLRACFDRIVAGAPRHIRVHRRSTRAVAMDDALGVPYGQQTLRLEHGDGLVHLDAVVLAQGHLPARLSAQQARTAGLARIHHLTYLTPGNPADMDTDVMEPGRPVLLRGLGLNFFDHMALLTEGRGGRYEECEGKLVYRPSDKEPTLYAFSRRGVPYHARGRNQKGTTGRYHSRLLTPETIQRMRGEAPAGLRFSTDLWPLIAKEVESVYYAAFLERQGRGAERDTFTERYLAAGQADSPALLDAYRIAPPDRWDWERLHRPCAGRHFADRAAFRSWLLRHLERDVREAEAGNVDGPLKAALDVLRDLRNEVRLAVDHNGLRDDSHRDELEGWYTPLNAYLSIGPPASRIRELIALIEAGVVDILGPGTEVRFDAAAPGFVAASAQVPGEPVHSTALIEARLPVPDLRRTTDPLLSHLLNSDQAAPYQVTGDRGSHYETGGLAVTGRPYRIVDAYGRAHPRRFAYGVPTEAVHWATAAGTRPGVDSVTLGDADAMARAVLALAPAAQTSTEWPPAVTADVPGVIV